MFSRCLAGKECPQPCGSLGPHGAGPPLKAQEAALDWPALSLPERKPGLGVSKTPSRSNSAFYVYGVQQSRTPLKRLSSSSGGSSSRSSASISRHSTELSGTTPVGALFEVAARPRQMTPRGISYPLQHWKQMRDANPVTRQTEGLAASTGRRNSQEGWGTISPRCGPRLDPVRLVSSS